MRIKDLMAIFVIMSTLILGGLILAWIAYKTWIMDFRVLLVEVGVILLTVLNIWAWKRVEKSIC